MENKSRIFIDSGGHSLHTQLGKSLPLDFMETDGFWEYVDNYCKYIIANKHLLETYVSVDVVDDPELTWKVQKYMESEYGLNPLPTYHVGEDWKWFLKYVDNYDYIALAGLGRQVTKSQWIRNMGDPVFTTICKPPHYIPTHKIHGFAMTSPSLLAMYPWYSVDSTSWIQFGKYGVVVIPRKSMGKYNYSESPHLAFVTSRPAKKVDPNHFDNFVEMNQAYFFEYFEEKGFVVGKSEFKYEDPKTYKLQENECWASNRKDGNSGLVEMIIEKGLSNNHVMRDELNIQFYMDLEASLPPWPYAWKKKAKASRLF